MLFDDQDVHKHPLQVFLMGSIFYVRLPSSMWKASHEEENI